jgi:hypothetical protein
MNGRLLLPSPFIFLEGYLAANLSDPSSYGEERLATMTLEPQAGKTGRSQPFKRSLLQ